MSIAALAVQDALVALLTDATPVAERVYDEPPRDQSSLVPADVYPYINIGESQALPDDAACIEGSEEFVDLHVWSQPKENTGWVEAKEIVSAIYALVHDATLSIEGRASAHSWVRDTRFLKDPDGFTRHAVLTLRILHHA